MNSDVIVIGGGPAGMLSAATAAKRGRSVVLIEKNDKLGRKLAITGKGRCNLTNDCSREAVLESIPVNSRFLMSALSRFGPTEVMNHFQSLGVPLKVERGGRVFPVSDKAFDIVDALKIDLKKHGVRVVASQALCVLSIQDSVCEVKTDHGTHVCKSVILATGGMSYPATGSTGDGYRIAREMGHNIAKPKPSLVPLTEEGDTCRAMQGLSLKNVSIKARDKSGKIVFEDMGELLFTHFGLSGPLVLSASAHMRDFENNRYSIDIDLKPGLDEKKLDQRLLRDFEKYANREFINSLDDLLPRLMIPVIVERSSIPPETRVHSITKKQRAGLVEILKQFNIAISKARPIEEAIVTSGGVDTRQIHPATMESKLVKGLYFAGEIIDLDAYTGGFNLQIAWSTGNAAGNAV